MLSHHISCRIIFVLSSHLRLALPSCLLPSSFPNQTLGASLLPLYVPDAPYICNDMDIDIVYLSRNDMDIVIVYLSRNDMDIDRVHLSRNGMDIDRVYLSHNDTDIDIV